MYRAASRFPKGLISTSLAGATVLHEQSREKLSIYPSPTPDVVLVETPSALENKIGDVRRRVCQLYRESREYVQGWVSKWIGVEHAIENRIKSIVSPEEPLTPGLLYVGVATLTGSILARNRMFVTRLILPPVSFVASAKYFLPRTSHNLSDYLGSVEDTLFPDFAEKHDIAKAHSSMTWERIREGTKDARARVNHSAVSTVEKIQETTGLKLQEIFERAEDTNRRVKASVAEVEQLAEQAIEEVKPEVEEVKHAIEGKVEKQD